MKNVVTRAARAAAVAICAVGVASTFGGVAAWAAPPKPIISGVSYAGDGCPQGSVKVGLTGNALSITMKKMNLVVDPDADGPQLKHCTVSFTLKAAPLTNLDGVDMAGLVEVGEGTVASARSRITIGGSVSQLDTKRIPGIGLFHPVPFSPFSYHVLYGENALPTPGVGVPVTIELRSLVNGSGVEAPDNFGQIQFKKVKYTFS